MPTSTYSHIPAIISFLQMIEPMSILDIGIGNGKMGFIARDFLDVMMGQRYKRENWSVRIDGIEVFSDYIQEHQRAIYDEIYIGDSFEIIDTVGNYDLLILGDVLEHFEKEKAWFFLDKCAGHCTRYLIINIPFGEKWTQPQVYGNSHEEHLSFWSYDDFAPFVHEKEIFSFQNIGTYGCLLIEKTNYMHHRVREKADAIYNLGKHKESSNYMKERLSALPVNVESEYLLVDLLLRSHNIKEAIERLKKITQLFPDDTVAKGYLERLMVIEKR